MAKRYVRGVSEARRALREVARYASFANQSAARDALGPTLAMAKDLVPEDEGALKKALVIRRHRRSTQGKAIYRVGPRADARDEDGNPVYSYASLVEFGAFRKEGGLMPAQPYMRPAFDATKDVIVQGYKRLLGPALEKQARRLAARRGQR